MISTQLNWSIFFYHEAIIAVLEKQHLIVFLTNASSSKFSQTGDNKK